MNSVKRINEELISQLLEKAKKSERLRSHHNFHEAPESAVQRLCIALCRGTFVKPHMHPQSNKWEFMMIVSGRVRVMLFNESGEVVDVLHLESGTANVGAELPSGVFHTVFPLDEEAVIFEYKEGPYNPDLPAIFASWAPDEGDIQCREFLLWADNAQVGDCFSH